jgi:hypothetical protein
MPRWDGVLSSVCTETSNPASSSRAAASASLRPTTLGIATSPSERISVTVLPAGTVSPALGSVSTTVSRSSEDAW